MGATCTYRARKPQKVTTYTHTSSKSFNFLSGTTRSSKTLSFTSVSQNVVLLAFFISGYFLICGIHYLQCTIDLDSSLSSIIALLKRFFWSQFLLKFDVTNPCSFHFLCPCCKCSCLPVKSSSTVHLADFVYGLWHVISNSYIFVYVLCCGHQAVSQELNSPSEQ